MKKFAKQTMPNHEMYTSNLKKMFSAHRGLGTIKNESAKEEAKSQYAQLA
jgi:hypothetical protein